LKNRIQSFYDLRSNALLMREFQKRLLELNRFDLPDTFLKRWLGYNNESLQPEQIELEYPAFSDNLRWSLLRDRLKRQFDIFVSEDDLKAEYTSRVRNYFQAELPDNIIQSSVDRLMQDEKEVEETRGQLETDKIFEAIRAEITTTDRVIPSDEFHQILDEVTNKAKQEQEADGSLRETIE
jgi:trigger factor